MGTTSQAGTGTATSTHYPANTFGYQQPYGQSPAYQPGPYPNNPPPPAAGSYSPYPTGQEYPPAQPPYPSQGAQGYQPYPTDMPQPPSYESAAYPSTASVRDSTENKDLATSNKQASAATSQQTI
ncbi:hypothetical protein ACROYT_G012236 [Oculina patagonica]